MSDETTVVAQKEPGQSLEHLANKYLTFRLGDEEYGIEILKVVEIIKMMDITCVPRVPEAVRGVINLRGEVIPVTELRKQFGMTPIEDSDETCIIVVKVQVNGQESRMGIFVDTVSEVRNIQAGEIEPPPSFGSSIHTDFILGMAKSEECVTILLDIDRVMTGEELEALSKVE